MTDDNLAQARAEIARLRAKLDNSKKLSDRDVALMRRMYQDGYKQHELADVFDVNPATVSRTVRGIYH